MEYSKLLGKPSQPISDRLGYFLGGLAGYPLQVRALLNPTLSGLFTSIPAAAHDLRSRYNPHFPHQKSSVGFLGKTFVEFVIKR